MKKIVFVLTVLLMAAPVFCADNDSDNITDIPEKGGFQKGLTARARIPPP